MFYINISFRLDERRGPKRSFDALDSFLDDRKHLRRESSIERSSRYMIFFFN